VGVAAGAHAARTSEAITSNIANIEKRFIFLSPFLKFFVYILHRFCKDIVRILSTLSRLSIY
jgi:hypothetical protein